jgi:ribosome recycling factor
MEAALIMAGAQLAGGLAKNKADEKMAAEKLRQEMEDKARQRAFDAAEAEKKRQQERLQQMFAMKSKAVDTYGGQQQNAFDRLMQSYAQTLS